MIIILIAIGIGYWYWNKKIEKETISLPTLIKKKSVQKQPATSVAPPSQAELSNPTKSESEKETSISQTNAADDDLTNIPSIPDSVQIGWDKTDDFEEVTYQVKKEAAEIIEYYISNLPQKGFNLVLKTEDMASFKKSKSTFDIQILDETDKMTTYKITYWMAK